MSTTKPLAEDLVTDEMLRTMVLKTFDDQAADTLVKLGLLLFDQNKPVFCVHLVAAMLAMCPSNNMAKRLFNVTMKEFDRALAEIEEREREGADQVVEYLCAVVVPGNGEEH